MAPQQLLHASSVSRVFLTDGEDGQQRVVKAYRKSACWQARHVLNISREVSLLQRLQAERVPGVVQLLGTAEDAHALYLVFEHCAGGDLYRRLASQGTLSEAQLCREVVVPLLRVLAHLHERGIIHRDIKPENLFFTAAGELRLGDLGLAIDARHERPVTRLGTVEYMAPEVVGQPSPDLVALHRLAPSQLPAYGPAVDVWALGVLVHEVLTGSTPFAHHLGAAQGGDAAVTSLMIQFRPPAPLLASAACCDFVAAALRKAPVQRPSARQLLSHPWVLQHARQQGRSQLAAAPDCSSTCSEPAGGSASTASELLARSAIASSTSALLLQQQVSSSLGSASAQRQPPVRLVLQPGVAHPDAAAHTPAAREPPGQPQALAPAAGAPVRQIAPQAQPGADRGCWHSQPLPPSLAALVSPGPAPLPCLAAASAAAVRATLLPGVAAGRPCETPGSQGVPATSKPSRQVEVDAGPTASRAGTKSLPAMGPVTPSSSSSHAPGALARWPSAPTPEVLPPALLPALKPPGCLLPQLPEQQPAPEPQHEAGVTAEVHAPRAKACTPVWPGGCRQSCKMRGFWGKVCRSLSAKHQRLQEV